MAVEYAKFSEVWGDDPCLTARQAYGIAVALDWFADAEIDPWLENPSEAPLHEVPPFNQFDLRVMMLVGDNRAWAALAAEHCHAVAKTFRDGTASFFNPGATAPPYFDELVVAAAVPFAQDQMHDMPEFYEGIPARMSAPDGADDDDDWLLDDEDGWSRLIDILDDGSARPDWADPILGPHPSARCLMDENHPFTWFDRPSAPSPTGV